MNVHEAHEVAYWSRKFGVSAEKQKQVVAAAGVLANDVEAFLLT